MTRNPAKGITIKDIISPFTIHTCKAYTGPEVSTLASDIKNYFVNFKVHKFKLAAVLGRISGLDVLYACTCSCTVTTAVVIVL